MSSRLKALASILVLLCLAACADDLQESAPELTDPDFLRGADLAQPVEAYSYSTGLGGEYLALAADGAYRRVLWNDGGANSRHEGHFRREGDDVLLERPEHDNAASENLDLRFRAVRWGERRYLIADRELWWLWFCNAVNSGSEPATGGWSTFFLREGDLERPAAGAPDIPEPWKDHLLVSPIEARTIEAMANGEAWVDAGSDHGVFVDMQLWLPQFPIPPESRKAWGGTATTAEVVKVVAVEERRCRVSVIIHPGWSVPAGLVVSSRNPSVSAAR